MADPRINVILGAKDDASKVVKGLRGQFEQFKKDAMAGFGLGAGISVFNTAKQALGNVVDVVGDAINEASNLEEAQAKVNEVFGDANAEIVTDWASDAADNIGLAESEALDAVGTFGNFITALGNSEDEAKDMGISLVDLAADLASFNNTEIDDVLVALRSGLAGEAEPMRRLGVSISVARIEANLLAKGVVKTKSEITDAMKVSERYNIIMEDTATAHGDFARTSEGLANKQRILKAQVTNALAAIGAALLPVAQGFTALGAEVIPAAVKAAQDLAGVVSDLGDDLGAMASGEVREATTEIQLLAKQYGVTEDAILEQINTNRQMQRELEATTALQEAQAQAAAMGAGNFETYTEWLAEMDRAEQGLAETTSEATKENVEYVLAAQQVAAHQQKLEFWATRNADGMDRQTDATDGTDASMADFVGTVTSLFQPLKDVAAAAADFAEEQRTAAEKAEELGEAIEHVADVSFKDVKQSAKEANDAIKAAFDDPMPSIEKLRKEEERLARQRRRAMREGRFDIVAMIDKRREAIGEQITQRQTVNKHYKAEKRENAARKRHIEAIKEQTGKSHAKAKKLYDLFGKDWKIHLDTKQAKQRLADLKQQLVDFTSSTVYVDFRANERGETSSSSGDNGGNKNQRSHTGGVIAPGETAVIRQNEAVLTPASRTAIVPLDGPGAPRGNGGGGNVYLDGYLVGKVIDEYQGRQYGTASRVTNYRRTN